MSKHQELTLALKKLLANTYATYLKTQNCHWNLKGINFIPMHMYFEELYELLADKVDSIAEKIVMLNEYAPASFSSYQKLSIVGEINEKLSQEKMTIELVHNLKILVDQLEIINELATDTKDVDVADFAVQSVGEIKKRIWFLSSTLEK